MSKSTWTEYKRLLGYLKPYYRPFLFASLCMFVVSVTAGVAAYLIQPLLDDIFINKKKDLLKLVPFVLIVIYFMRGVARYTSSTIMQKIGQLTVRDIRNHLYSHIQTLSLSFFQKHTTGRLMSRIVNDIQLIQDSISIVVYDVIRESLTVIVLISLLLYRDPVLTVIAVIALPFSGIMVSRLGKILKGLTTNSQERMADLTSMMSEAFTGYRIVQAFGMQKYEIERFKKENQNYFELILKAIKINEVSSPLLEFFAVLGVAAIIWYGGLQVVEGKYSVGNFFSFLTALFLIFNPISKLSRVYNKIQQAMGAAGRVFEIIDTDAEIKNLPDAKDIKRIKDSIEIKNVSFSYDTEPVLKNINIKVKAGEVLAIVGMSGVGKSTLADLIPRFYDPTEGEIFFDGFNIKDATIESLRGQIGIVTQEVFLFNDTIRNNIAYGNLDMPLEKVKEATQSAYAEKFIEEMESGFDTLIGERGLRLSGGQRQRLSIARAILKDPAILILDEATSALDTESEIEVQKALNNLMKDRTTFVIAHRLSTIHHADRIIVLDGGRIVEEGNHETLLEKNGQYKKVYDLQFANHLPMQENTL